MVKRYKISVAIRDGFLFPSFAESMPVDSLRPSNNVVPDSLRLADALSAFYPKESEEKRLLETIVLTILS